MPSKAEQPRASRPYMPGYGLPDAAHGKGLLPWSWAERRLVASHNYWCATARPEGGPHLMIIWGVWLGGQFWFSTGDKSRKARNLAANPACVIGTERASSAVIIEGTARRVEPRAVPREVSTSYKKKYNWVLDPKLGPIIAVTPRVAFGLHEKDFDKSTTRWTF
jgi:general stress protein 26